MMEKAVSFDDYIRNYPPDVQEKLTQIRSIIRNAAPTSKEVISYGMPAFKQYGILVYFAAHKSHIGFYPTSSGISVFMNELSDFIFSKGAIQFPFKDNLPEELITRIVKFRLMEDSEKWEAKKKRK